MSDRSASGGNAERGFVLVSVLLVLGAIASLLVMLQSTSRSIAVGIEAEIRMRQGQHLADAGLVRIMAALENPSEGMFTRLREGRESVLWEFDGTDIALSLASESGKIDLNAGDPDLIGKAAGQVTDDRARAQEIYQYVLDRRAKRIAFSNPLEILSPRERLSPLAGTVREMFTVLTRARGIDPLRASDAVLKAIPGITQRDLKLIEESRRELSLYRHMQPISHLMAAFSPERPIYTLRAAVIGPKGRRIIREAVVLLQHEESPIMVIAWGNVISPALPMD